MSAKASVQVEAKERPIIFAPVSLDAILEGGKTQVRRVLDPQPLDVITKTSPRSADPTRSIGGRRCWCAAYATAPKGRMLYCRYGEVGDRLWARELHRYNYHEKDGGEHYMVVEYEGGARRRCATGPAFSDLPEIGLAWRSPYEMHRWASRLTLELTEVRLERVQDIKGGDAWAEGARADGDVGTYYHSGERIEVFRHGWDELNAKRGFGWDVNPWVWVLSFRRVN